MIFVSLITYFHPYLQSQEESEAETELSTTHCVTCGHEINVKTAMKHMEKCFTKVRKEMFEVLA